MFENFDTMIESGKKLERTPGCYWFPIGTDKYNARLGYVGYRFDGRVYLLKRAQYIGSQDRYEHEEWARVWMDNQAWWLVSYPEDEDIRNYLFSRLPSWLDVELAQSILSGQYKELATLPEGPVGRYVIKRSGYLATCQRDLLWLAHIGPSDTLDDVQFDSSVHLLYNNNENRFTGHPLQIWSDGVWTRGQFLSGFGKKNEIHPDAAVLLKHIKKTIALDIGVEKILSIQWCNKTEIADWESESRGLCSSYSEEYRAESWETSIGTFYLLFWEWGAFDGEGDSGDSGDVFLSLGELKTEFLRRTDTQRKLPE